MSDPLAPFAEAVQRHVTLGGAVTPDALRSCAITGRVVVATTARQRTDIAEAICFVERHSHVYEQPNGAPVCPESLDIADRAAQAIAARESYRAGR